MEWIRVEVGLPDTKEPVFVYIKSDYVDYMLVAYYDNGWMESVVSEGYDNSIDYIDYSGDITHWMPLPEPPESRENDV